MTWSLCVLNLGNLWWMVMKIWMITWKHKMVLGWRHGWVITLKRGDDDSWWCQRYCKNLKMIVIQFFEINKSGWGKKERNKIQYKLNRWYATTVWWWNDDEKWIYQVLEMSSSSLCVYLGNLWWMVMNPLWMITWEHKMVLDDVMVEWSHWKEEMTSDDAKDTVKIWRW